MSQFTSNRGETPTTVGEVVLDTRESVLKTDRNGHRYADVEGDVVVVVRPVGNVGTCTIFVNGDPRHVGIAEEDIDELVEEVLASFEPVVEGFFTPDVEEEEPEATE